MNQRRRHFQHRPIPTVGGGPNATSRDPRKALLRSSRSAQPAASAAQVPAGMNIPEDEPWDPFSISSGDIDIIEGRDSPDDSIFSSEWNAGGSSAFGDSSLSSDPNRSGVSDDSSWSSFRNVIANGAARVVDWASPQPPRVAYDGGNGAAEPDDSSSARTPQMKNSARRVAGGESEDISNNTGTSGRASESITVNRAREIIQQRNRERGIQLKALNEATTRDSQKSRRQLDPVPSSSHGGKRQLDPPAAAPAAANATSVKLGQVAGKNGVSKGQASKPLGADKSQMRTDDKQPISPPQTRAPTKTKSLDSWQRRQRQQQVQQRFQRQNRRSDWDDGSMMTANSVLTDEMSEAQRARRKGRKIPKQKAGVDPVRTPAQPPQRPPAVTPPLIQKKGESIFSYTRDESRLPQFGHLKRHQQHVMEPAHVGSMDEYDMTLSPMQVDQTEQKAWDGTEHVAKGEEGRFSMARLVENALQEATWTSQSRPTSTTSPGRCDIFRRTHPSAHRSPSCPDSRPTTTSSGAATSSNAAGMRGQFTSKPDANPPEQSPTSITSMNGNTTIMRLPPQRHVSVKLVSPTRSDHSADAAAGAMNGLRDVRRRMFGPAEGASAKVDPPGNCDVLDAATFQNDGGASGSEKGSSLREVFGEVYERQNTPPNIVPEISWDVDHVQVSPDESNNVDPPAIANALDADAAASQNDGSASGSKQGSSLRDVFREVYERQNTPPDIAAEISWDVDHVHVSAEPSNIHAPSAFKSHDAPASPVSGISRKVSWDDETIPTSPNVNLGAKNGRSEVLYSASNKSANMSVGSRSPRRPMAHGAASVASAQHSVETECVRQNAAIAVAMGDMMDDFFMDMENGNGDCFIEVGDDPLEEGSNYCEPKSPGSYRGSQVQPVAEERSPYRDSKGRMNRQTDDHCPLQGPAAEYTTTQHVDPENALAFGSSKDGPPVRTPLRSNHRQDGSTIVNKLSNLLLLPTPSEEYDDPSLFDNSLMSDSSSELTPAPLKQRSAPVAAARGKDSLSVPGNQKKKDLSNFLDQFGDRILLGCDDGEGESSDVFFVENSQFGQDVGKGHFGRNSGPSSSKAVSIDEPPSLATSSRWNESEQVEDEDSIFEDEDPIVFQTPQRAKPSGFLGKKSALPPASTFLSAKERARIRQHDTTPLRANTSRARRAMGPQFSYSEASMCSIKEDDEESDGSTVEDERSVTDESSSSQSWSSEDESDDPVQSSASSSYAVTSSVDEGKKGQCGVEAIVGDGNVSRSEMKKDPVAIVSQPQIQRGEAKSSRGKKREDPPEDDTTKDTGGDIVPAHDMMKMTYREKRKGHSFAWHSANGVNGDELYDSKQLPPSRAKRATTLAGRLNLLSISSFTAGTFREHFGDEESSHNPLYNPSLVENRGEQESPLTYSEEERVDDDDDASDDEYEIESWDGEDTPDTLLKDFQDILSMVSTAAAGNQSNRDIELQPKSFSPKKPQPAPANTSAADRAAGDPCPPVESNQKTRMPPRRSAQTTEKISMQRATLPPQGRYQMKHDSKRNSAPRPDPVRPRGGVPPRSHQIRHQHRHPHQVPKDKELTRSRLEQKLLGIGGGVTSRRDCGSVGTSELGSLLTRDSERSHVGNLPVPTTIFHRTHPRLPAPGETDSARSSPSSMQNTYSGSAYNGSILGGIRALLALPPTPEETTDEFQAGSDEINSLLLPDDAEENAQLVRPPAKQTKNSGTVRNLPMDAQERRAHFKATADAIAKIDAELRSNRQRDPQYSEAAVSKGPNLRKGNISSSGAVHLNRVRSAPKRVTVDRPLDSLPNGPEMRRTKSDRMDFTKSMQPNHSRTLDEKQILPASKLSKKKSGSTSNAIEVMASPSLRKKGAHGRKQTQAAVVTINADGSRSAELWKSHSSGSLKDFKVATIITSRRESNDKAAPRPSPATRADPKPSSMDKKDTGQKQIPASFNTSRSVRKAMGANDNMSQHSSIFEAFEVAPLRTIANSEDGPDDTSAFLNDVGVHHALVRKGSKRVGFPMTQAILEEEENNILPAPLVRVNAISSSTGATIATSEIAAESGIKDGSESFEVMIPPRLEKKPQRRARPSVTNQKVRDRQQQVNYSNRQGGSQRDRIRQRIRSGLLRRLHR